MEKNFKKIFSENFCRLMNEKGIKVKQLQDKTGIDIARFRSGDRLPSLNTAYKLANELGVSLDELCGIEMKSVSQAIHDLVKIFNYFAWPLEAIANIDSGLIAEAVSEYISYRNEIDRMLELGGVFAEKAKEMLSPEAYFEKICDGLKDTPLREGFPEIEVEEDLPF